MANDSLITENNPTSAVSEAYRILRSNLYYSNIDKKIQIILITSPTMGDGKTTTSANLAITLAQGGNKTLYLGADLRKPRGYALFGVGKAPGISEAIIKGLDYKAVIMPYKDIDNLNLLLAGAIPPNPAEMIQSKAMRHIIEEVREDYDYIIIDAPPINSVSDTLTLAQLSDGVIITIAENITKRDESNRAIKSLRTVDAHILGAVITRTKRKKKDYYVYK